MDITCKCGVVISDMNIVDQNKTNEEGEDYAEVSASCDKCGAEFETSKWGSWENVEDAKEFLQAYINQ